MKSITTKMIYLLVMAAVWLQVSPSFGQTCLPITGACTNYVSQYPAPSVILSTTSSSWTPVSTFMNGGNWTLFSVTAGNTYQWSYCNDFGGREGWNAQLTLSNYSTGTILCYSNNSGRSNCPNAPYIGWTATFTGTVRLLTSMANCQSNTGTPYSTLVWRQSATGSTGCTGWAVSPTAQSFNATGGTSTFVVSATSGSNCTYSAVSSDPDWLSWSPTQATVTYRVANNSSTSPRTGTISIQDVNANRIVATFTVNQSGQQVTNYTITANANAGGTASGTNSYPANSQATVMATANSGYTFTNWTENGNIVSTQATYSFPVTGSRTLFANFTQNVQNYTITANANAGGTASGTNSYPANSQATVTATANAGYSFRDWTEGGSFVTSQNPYTFPVTGSRTLTANFTATPGCNPTLNAGSNSIPASGGTGSFTVTAGNGCTWNLAQSNCSFVQWSTTSGTGNATVSYTVPANSTPNARTCTITLGGQTYTITQNGSNQNCPLVKPVISLMAGCVLRVPAQTDATYQWKRLGTIVGTSSNLYEVTNSGLYLCTVSLPNIANCSVMSEYFHVVYSNGSCVVNNSEIESATQLKVYPNPNKGSFTIDFDLPEPKLTTIRMYNALGQCVYTAAAEKRVGHQNHPIVLNKAASGLYWVEIQLDDQKMVKKVMVE